MSAVEFHEVALAAAHYAAFAFGDVEHHVSFFTLADDDFAAAINGRVGEVEEFFQLHIGKIVEQRDGLQLVVNGMAVAHSGDVYFLEPVAFLVGYRPEESGDLVLAQFGAPQGCRARA